MNETEHTKLLLACQHRIAALLAGLEAATGCYVDGISIHDDDITTVQDSENRYVSRVVIDLKRAPGSRWDTGR